MDKQVDKQTILATIKEWFWLNVGTLLVALGVYFFKAPNKFSTGGVSGIAIILTQIPGMPLNQSTIVMIFNVVLLVIGALFLGKGCTFRTIYCSLVYAGENMLFEYLVPLDGPLTNQPLMELCYAMILTGAGSAIIFNYQGSSGGTDIIALILRKYSKINVGRALLMTDFVVAVSSFFVSRNISIGLFSLLGLFAKSFLVDAVIESISSSKYITIISSNPQEIEDYIIHHMKRSYTTYEATGGFTGEKRQVIITVCKTIEAARLKSKVKQYDPYAFTIISPANEILGKGFRCSV